MQIAIQATEHLTDIEGVPVRLWHGTTKAGVKCLVFVHRIAVHESENAEEFARTLQEQMPAPVAIPLRNIL